jgi:hypothetical protein
MSPTPTITKNHRVWEEVEMPIKRKRVESVRLSDGPGGPEWQWFWSPKP